jgi:hypothetical protein
MFFFFFGGRVFALCRKKKLKLKLKSILLGIAQRVYLEKKYKKIAIF